jgi:hypothetical protein
MLKKIKIFDFITITILIFISLSYLFIEKNDGSKKILLIVENKTKTLKHGKYKYNLKKDFKKNIIIEVDNYKARIIKSDCINKICIKTGWIEKCGESAICLPNRTAIQIQCEKNDIDAISR